MRESLDSGAPMAIMNERLMRKTGGILHLENLITPKRNIVFFLLFRSILNLKLKQIS